MLTQGQVGGVVPAVLALRSAYSTRARFWIETIALVSAIACVLALVIATLGAAMAGAASGEQEPGQPRPSSAIPPQIYEGIITDAHCGAKHSAAIGRTAADCTIVCVRGGEQFALVDGERSYLLEGDLAALKQVAGQRVRLIGALNGRKISVTSVVHNLNTASSRRRAEHL
jgi:hypothetical protein